MAMVIVTMAATACKGNSELNCSRTHNYIRAVIMPPAIGYFIEAAGDAQARPGEQGFDGELVRTNKVFPHGRVPPSFQIKQSSTLLIPIVACSRVEVAVAVHRCPPKVTSSFRCDTGAIKKHFFICGLPPDNFESLVYGMV